MKPIYKHDCAHCVYLGTEKNNDLYFCEEGGITEPSIIIRHSSDGPDYTSGICFAKYIPEIGNALKKAIEMGLISKKKADYLTNVNNNMETTLSTKAYKMVGYSGYTTIFIPTCKRVEEEYVNGKVGEQLWEQLTDDGTLCGNLWTLNEITGCGNAVEIPNPRQGNEELVRMLKELHEETETKMSQRKEGDEYRTYLQGQKDLLEILIKNIK